MGGWLSVGRPRFVLMDWVGEWTCFLFTCGVHTYWCLLWAFSLYPLVLVWMIFFWVFLTVFYGVVTLSDGETWVREISIENICWEYTLYIKFGELVCGHESKYHCFLVCFALLIPLMLFSSALQATVNRGIFQNLSSTRQLRRQSCSIAFLSTIEITNPSNIAWLDLHRISQLRCLWPDSRQAPNSVVLGFLGFANQERGMWLVHPPLPGAAEAGNARYEW